MSAGTECGVEGEHFGGYQLIRRLGRGGMAETFEAIRRGNGGLEHRVCLKRILPVFDGDQDFVALFLREATISATLRHSNVAQVLDFGDVEGRHYLALELVDGVDLRALLRGRREAGETLDGDILGYILVELAQALDYAHAATDDGKVRGVVHRDISPSNVLIAPSGDVKLTDFGVAKAMTSPSLTRTGGAKGKIPYMAPEYASRGVCDARSDLFSLGVMLYECAAGRRPFDGANDIETLERIRAGDHVSLADIASVDLPRAVADAIESLLSRDPEARPANAAMLLELLASSPPRPSARLALGKLVSEQSRARVSEGLPLGLIATARATPGGTVVVVADAAPAPWRVDSAPADAETRTRLPDAGAHDSPTRAQEDRTTPALGLEPETRAGGDRHRKEQRVEPCAEFSTTATAAGIALPVASFRHAPVEGPKRASGTRTALLGLAIVLTLAIVAWLLRGHLN